VLEGAAEPVHAPGRDHVELATRRALEHAVERWALIAPLGAADPVVAVLLHDLPATALGHAQQLTALVLDGLPVSRYAGVDSDALCPGH
jgi:hypothetical protein